jgi:hypothetical protein
MPKIQGKQIAESTITQDLLNLTTPDSGQTTSAATVEYVNNYISSGSGTTAIGPAPDGTYSDGIFTDFVPTTPIGTAVDKFNEMLLLLAPTPPSTSWSGVFSNLEITSNQLNGNEAGAASVTPRTNITTDTTPDYGVTVSLASPQGQNGDSGTFTMSDSSQGTLNTVSLTTGDDSRTNVISLTESDPYDGQSGKAGFWSGITAMSVSGTLGLITPSATQHTLTFTNPAGSLTYNYYVDSVVAPTVTSASASFPTMTKYVSGVPSLATGASVTNIGFTVNNAVGYFYNPTIYSFTGTNITNVGYTAPTVVPSANSSFTETGKSTTISTGYAESISFQVLARNLAGTSGSAIISSGVYRIDTSSNESSRLTSGSGSYPSSGFGGIYDSEQVLTSGVGLNELMMLNSQYRYPTGNYTTYTDATNGAGPDYSSVTGTRWVTFNLGSFTSKGNFRINFAGASGIQASSQSDLLIEVLAQGSTATYWVDADVAYASVGDPGSTVNGTPAVTLFTTSTREITFGTQVLTGNLIIRVGLTAGSSVRFTGVTKTDLS